MNKERGQVWLCKLPKSAGSVQQNVRPCVIISNDKGNTYSNICTVIPITTQTKKPLPTHYSLTETNTIQGTVLCEQIQTIYQGYLLSYKGNLTETDLNEIEKCICIALNLSPYKDNSVCIAFNLEDFEFYKDTY